MDNFHTPVLLQEVLAYLQVAQGKKYIDATLGGGGHTVEMLKQGGRVLGIDADEEAVEYVREKNLRLEPRIQESVTLVQGNFREIDQIAKEHEFDNVSGILFDLGISSYQLENSKRGFSFQQEGPLDMRMDKRLSVTAADLVAALSKKELYDLFIQLGEERRAHAVSNNIIKSRRVRKIQTTRDLSVLVEQAYGMEQGVTSQLERSLANRRVFQALRIAVNDELHALEEALPKAIALLEDKGRVAVISFHSLEDRIVKHTFLAFEKQQEGMIITKKPIQPTEREQQKNRRSMSAKLRVFERRII